MFNYAKFFVNMPILLSAVLMNNFADNILEIFCIPRCIQKNSYKKNFNETFEHIGFNFFLIFIKIRIISSRMLLVK